MKKYQVIATLTTFQNAVKLAVLLGDCSIVKQSGVFLVKKACNQ